jgi:hypothetical protein
MRNVTGLRCLYAAVAAVALAFSAESANAQEEAPLPATPTPPPDVQERQKVEKPPAPPARSPGLEELIEKISRQPGGAEKLDRAERGGARIPRGRTGRPTLEPSPERKPGPRVEGPVLSLSSTAEQQNVMKVTRAASAQSVAGLGEMWVLDFVPLYTTASTTLWGPYNRWASSWPFTGNFDIKPFMTAAVKVDATGWYLINFAAARGKASILKAGQIYGTYPLMVTWDHSASANEWEWYPHVVNLAAGWHFFYLVPDPNYPNWHFYVTEVSVTKL